ncbi:MAG: helix-turn-helix transcriptional regulator [Nocardioidaceae bacterium]|nr:helix-turn-helix transcriptional regulator [Nocardioidaceae bacterium]NUS51621.1 helix-turn-helix transcriptional regulator [Nocardioidaceae bacterium]
MPKPLPLLDPLPSADVCCTPLTSAPLSAEQAEDLAVRLKAIADPTRLRLLSIVLSSQGMEACTCDLTGPLGLSQPTVSHHLKKLAAAGLVVGERRGTWTYYRVVPDALAALAAVITPGG